MPGLLRGVARVAVVSGTASAVSNRVTRRQSARWAEQGTTQPGYMQPVGTQAPPPPQPAGSSQGDKIQQLKDLADLKASGVLTEAEFEEQKAKVLAG